MFGVSFDRTLFFNAILVGRLRSVKDQSLDSCRSWFSSKHRLLDPRMNNSFDQFPWWDYLNQHLFDPERPFVWSLEKFRHIHRVQKLERCWERSEVYLLEHCWRQETDEKNT